MGNTSNGAKFQIDESNNKFVKVKKLFSSKKSSEQSTENQPYEWRKLVGSIRRRVQRHVSNVVDIPNHNKPSTSAIKNDGNSQTQTYIQRKGVIVQQKIANMLTREKSKDNLDIRIQNNSDKYVPQRPPLVKCYSSEKKNHRPTSPTLSRQWSVDSETDVIQESKKSVKCYPSKPHRKSKDDFLKATMRIFLVVSPPVGKLQVRSRSLNHLDTLEHLKHRQSIAEENTLKDSHSEPDCANKKLDGIKNLLTVPKQKKEMIVDHSRNFNSPSSSTTAQPPYNYRRNKFSRSQLSSSEYFSISFEHINREVKKTNECQQQLNSDKDEFLPALKGITLREALINICEKKKLTIEQCEVFLESNETPLLLSQDTLWLSGKHLRIKVKDNTGDKKSISKKSSSSTEDTTSTSSSCHDCKLSLLTDSDQHKKHGKQRWSGFFNTSKQDTRLELLIERLNYYSKHGIPPIQYFDTNNNMENSQSDWMNFVDFKNLTEKQQQQQTALWELITTEIAYIHVLKVVTDLFLACLQNLQLHGILLEIDINQLFSNIVEILNTNLYFWTTYLVPIVDKMKTGKQPINPISELYEGLTRINDIFNPYIQYCKEQSQCQQYCRDSQENNELFTAYLAWCETQKQCNRLRLSDILVIPMQRLTKYGLLLKAVHRNTDNEHELAMLNEMIRCVDNFVHSVNLNLKQKQDIDRLQTVISRIEGYEAMECKDEELEKLIRSHCQLDLTCPMLGCSIERKRHLLLEGDLRFKDHLNSKIDVHCFLLTDMLLICKNSAKKHAHSMKVVRQPYIVDRLMVTELNRETPSLALIYLNEYSIAVGAFILQNNDVKKLKYWVESIKRAQLLYAKAKQASARQISAGTINDEYNEYLEYNTDFNYEMDSSGSTLVFRSPLLSSSRDSQLSSLAPSNSESVEISEHNSYHQQPLNIIHQKAISLSSDENINAEKNPQRLRQNKRSLKKRLFYAGQKPLSCNTLTVQSANNLVQSLPNLVLGGASQSKPIYTSQNYQKNTLLVPNTKVGQLLGPALRGTSYPPPSPPRNNLQRGFAFVQTRNPPLVKTKNVNSFTSPNLVHSLMGYDTVETKSITDDIKGDNITNQQGDPEC